MQKWEIKSKNLTLVDHLQEQGSSSLSKLKSTQKLQEQPFGTSATKVRCDTRCPSAKLRTNTPYTHTKVKIEGDIEIERYKS